MTWIVSKQSSQEELAERFRTLMAAPDLLQIPGAHDAMLLLSPRKRVFGSLFIRRGLHGEQRAARFRHHHVGGNG